MTDGEWIIRGSGMMTREYAAMLDDDAAHGGFWFLAVPAATDPSEVESEVSVHVSREARIDGDHVRIYRIRHSVLAAAGGKSGVLDHFENEDDGPSWVDFWTSDDREDWGPRHICFEHTWEWLTGEP